MNTGLQSLEAGEQTTAGSEFGFTLVECVTAIAVLAVIVTAGVPGFAHAINSWKLTTAANETLTILQLARIESIKSNMGVVLCVSSNQDSATQGCGGQEPTGWIAFTDKNRNLAFESDEKLLRVARLPRGIRVVAEGQTSPLFALRPDGLLGSIDGEGPLLTADITLCLPGSSAPIRRISVQAGSSVAVEKVLTEVSC